MVNKKTFVKMISLIEEQNKIDSNVSDVLSKCYDSWVGLYNNSRLTTVIKGLFVDMFGKSGEDWIDYFMYELNFGKRWKKGTCTQYGKEIKLGTIEQLYDVIVKWKKEEDKE